MIIESLEMENIRSHRLTSVHFDEGVTLIEGDVGSGKSSMLKAIQFALFGSGDPKSLLSYGKEDGRISLGFRIGERRYVVTRSLHRVGDKVRTTKGYWQGNSGMVPMSVSQLNEKVMDVLGIKGSERARRLPIWEYAFYTPQERLKAILSDKEVRSSAISAAFNTQKYRRAVANAQKLAAYFSNEALKYDSFSSDLEAKEKELEELTKSAVELEEMLKKAENELNAARQDAEKARLDYDLANKALNQASLKASQLQHEFDLMQSDMKRDDALIQELKARIEANKAKIDQITRKLSAPIPKFRPSSQIRKEIEELRDQVSTEKSKVAYMSKRLEDYQRALSQLPERPQLPLKSLRDIERDLDRAQDQLNGLKSLDMELGRLSESYNEMEQKGRCPCCGREIDKELAMKLKESATRKREELKKQLSDLSEQISRLKVQRDELVELQHKADLYESQQKNLKEIEGELVNLLRDEGLQEQEGLVMGIQEAIEAIKKRIDYMLSQVSSLNEELNSSIALEKEISLRHLLESEKEEIERSLENDSARLSKLKDELMQKEEKLKLIGSQLQAAVSERDAALAAANRAKDYYQNAGERLQEKLSTYSSLSAKRDEIKKRTESLSKEVEDKRDARNRAWEAKEVVNWLREVLIPLIAEIEQEVLARLNQEFQEKFSGFFSTLIGDPQKKVYIDEEFSPKMEHAGIEMDIDEGPSGGERSSLALAYRLALNGVAREVAGLSIDVIMLDEPTDGFSSEQLSRFRELIDSLNAKQVIVVSHEKELESVADRIIMTIKEGETSSVQLLQ